MTTSQNPYPQAGRPAAGQSYGPPRYGPPSIPPQPGPGAGHPGGGYAGGGYAGPPVYQPGFGPVAGPRNGFGVTSLVLGIVGLVFSVIPFVGVIAWPLVIVGLIFGILGINRARSGVADNKGMAVAGTVLSAIGLFVCISWTVWFGALAASTSTYSGTSYTGTSYTGTSYTGTSYATT